MTTLASRARPTGMVGFTLVWFGQLVSLTGSAMSQLALAYWAWQVTGSATALSLTIFFGFGPGVILSPLAGALVDRSNRKLMMMLSDLGAGLATLAILLLYLSGQLAIWHIYAAATFAGAFQTFQWPAYSAAISTMLERKDYARANGMMELAQAGSAIVAPALASFLLGVIGIAGVIGIEVVTLLIALATLSVVAVPQPQVSAEGQAARGSLWQESLYGFRYILARPSLLGLQLVFMGNNLCFAFFAGLLAPMILARTGSDPAALGSVLSAQGVGGVLGGLAMGIWGGPKRRVHGVLMGMILAGLFSVALMGFGQSVPVWMLAGLIGGLLTPVLNGSNQAIWQAKVAPDVQGKVFAARRMIAQLIFPISLLVAGPLADRFFEPAMREGGWLVPTLGPLIGSGPGAGIGLLIGISGLLSVVITLAAYLVPAVRNAEDRLPDHDQGKR
jgi:DHA3 family macrolide efflux protein-like MFS transporter